VAYATFTATAGSYEASYVTDVTGPVISSVVATPNSGGTATITWTTDEVSDSRVDYGTNPGALTLNATSSALDTSHSISLMGLSPNTIYYYRVRSTDAAGNASTSPAPPSAPNEFTTLFPAPTFTDTTASDFNKGTPGNCAVRHPRRQR
jgi:phosphodiesterase/alkaline phosphatase D-like protein